MTQNVALWFAKNSKGEIKTIDEVKYHDDKYYCPLCNSEVIPKALKVDSKVAEHFAHLDRSKCTPESMMHWWYKNKFILSGDKFVVTTDRTHTYVCKDILIEQVYHTKYGDYTPDVTVITESGDTIYFEYAFTNKKKVKDYLDKWFELGNIVVEVDLKTLLQANYGKDTYNFRVLFYKGKCFNTNRRDLYYKTIGEYKEQVYLTEKVDDKKKQEIEKLDWFWDSVQEYKIGKLTDEELYICFDEASDINSNVVADVLQKSRCTDILERCNCHRKRKSREKFEKYANDIMQKYNNNIIIKIGDFGFSIYSTFQGSSKNSNMRMIGDVMNLNHYDNHSIEYVEHQIDVELDGINRYNHYQQILANKTLWKAVKLIDEYVKGINPLYKFKFIKENPNQTCSDEKFKVRFGLYFYGNYSPYERLIIDITNNQLIDTDSFENIYLLFKNQIDDYRKAFIPLDKRLFDIMDSICNFYNMLHNNLTCKILKQHESNITLWFERKGDFLFDFSISNNEFNDWSIKRYGNEKKTTYNTLDYTENDLIKIIKNIISAKIRYINIYKY